MVQWRSYRLLYGTIEIRARMAGGRGTWPALWLLGANCQETNVRSADNTPPCDWPNPGSDEIDIAEILHGHLAGVNQQIHTSTSNAGCAATTSDVSRNWHIYTLVWRPEALVWGIDGMTTCTVSSSIPSHPMFLIINTAIGGVGSGPLDESSLPQLLSVDYVRAHR
jgi:beta-glucanase (GH16 family)